MKLHRTFDSRIDPAMPMSGGPEPSYDPITFAPIAIQPDPVVRPLFWWAKELRDQGYRLRSVTYEAATRTATIRVQLPSYRIVEQIRQGDNRRRVPNDPVEQFTEGVWRLGINGWGSELTTAVDSMRELGLLSVPVRPRFDDSQVTLDHVPDWAEHPEHLMRAMAAAVLLLKRGWQLHDCGEPTARGGFIAVIPEGDEGLMVVYPAGMVDDYTAASELANRLPLLTPQERNYIQIIARRARLEGQGSSK